MNRRGFIAIAGGTLAAGSPVAAWSSASQPALPLLSSYVTSVADTLRGQRLAVAPGMPLALRRLPERRFDPDSVGVARPDGQLLGYLPGSHGQILARLLDAGLSLTATATEARERPRPAIRLEVRLGRADAPTINQGDDA